MLANVATTRCNIARSPKGSLRPSLGLDGYRVDVKDPNQDLELLDGYAHALTEAKRAIQAARTKAVLAVNSEMIDLYWRLGQLIANREQTQGWGAKVVERLSNDLRAEFPDMTGLSLRNLRYMRSFALAWPDEPMLQRLVAKLPWGHNIELLDRLKDPTTRTWYAQQAIENGWTRPLLINQIMGQLHLRHGQALSNFERLLPAGDSELMRGLTKDPQTLEFIALAKDATERDFENALLANIDRFLRELGHGYTYAGRQYRLDLDGTEYFIDLLMFDVVRSRWLVLELKRSNSTPEAIGKLNFYIAVVDDLLRQPHHAETVGLLLCTGKDDRSVRYSLSRSTSPMAVASYRYTELLSLEQAGLPAEQELLDIVDQALASTDTETDPSR
jgi:predicted nuclease of restriction endonuclease-like (RecB) superfamily